MSYLTYVTFFFCSPSSQLESVPHPQAYFRISGFQSYFLQEVPLIGDNFISSPIFPFDTALSIPTGKG